MHLNTFFTKSKSEAVNNIVDAVHRTENFLQSDFTRGKMFDKCAYIVFAFIAVNEQKKKTKNKKPITHYSVRTQN